MTATSTILSSRELADWADDRRTRLERAVRRASSPAIRLLRKERATPDRLLALSEREIRDPDWRSGFQNRCTIVVRAEGAERGRLGLWERDGTLCLEKRVECGVLVLRGRKGELWMDGKEASLRPGCSPAQLHELADGALDGWRGIVTSVRRNSGSGRTVILFRTAERRFELRPKARTT